MPEKLSGTQRECMRAGRPRSRVRCPRPLLLLLKGAYADRPGGSAADASERSRFVTLRGFLFWPVWFTRAYFKQVPPCPAGRIIRE